MVASYKDNYTMTRITRLTAVVVSLISLLCSQPLYAETDALLDQIQHAWSLQGAEGYRRAAKSFGHQEREEQGKIMVPVIVEREISRKSNFIPRLRLAGAHLDAVSRSYARILVPIERLAQLGNQFPTERLSAPYPAYPAAFGLGSIVSESTSLTDADAYQVGNLTGSGVKVAVVDLGFSGLTNAKNQGELPANTVGVDFTGTGLETGTKHGTGVAEHVLDMAPGVTLYCLKVGSQLDLENAADYIRDNNIKIANHSVAWVLASYYDSTGPINNIINTSNSAGALWTVASGNQARQHWRGNWTDSDGDNNLEFAANDELLALSGSASTVSVYLNWNQYGFNNKTNLDLYVLNNAGTVVASSTTTQSRFNDPYEAVSFSYVASQAPYSVRVTNTGGANPSGLDITLFSFSHNFEHYTLASSILDPASADGAFTVGAVNQSTWMQTTPPLESYSGRGPTTDGRQKPDLVAPDGTSSLAYGTRGSFGTSFSSPTTAGAAALLLQENAGRTAATLASLLRDSATDIGTVGADPVYGYGKLQLPFIDSDSDQLSNKQEISLGTNALVADTDGDGLSDYAEAITYNTNPLLVDTDTDGLSDYAEVATYSTNPLLADTDADGLSDYAEVITYLTNPLLADTDNDGLSDQAEVLTHNTNPLLADTDGEGISDYAEVITYFTNPNLADTDGDGLNDHFEVVTYGTNPLASNRGDLAPRGQPDGVINAGDAVVMSRLASGSIAATATELTLGDLNYNSTLDAGDMVVMMRAIQGLTTLP